MIGAGGLSAKEVPKALRGLILQRRLAALAEPVQVPVSSPWDVWWAALPLAELGIRPLMPYGACRTCTADALVCAATDPPTHPDDLAERPRGCLRLWAVRMRGPGEHVVWPQFAFTIALINRTPRWT